jgi:2-succinyl-5-enolpyruvyl-6-hydroxy-3-cyclohexene-1-carboxylate synthase
VRPLDKNIRKWQPETKTGYYSHYVVDKKDEQTEPETSNGTNIEIIVTKSNNRCSEKKVVRSKFETDLDDEFLQLFAN